MMIPDSDIKKVATAADNKLDLKNAKLSDEYYYSCLPICIIDAVYSIGVTYKSVQNTVSRYADYFGIEKFRDGQRRSSLQS